MGFCTPEQTERFLEQVPAVEKAMVDSGIILIKYWLEVSPDEQTRRLEGRIHDPRKVWKLTDMDLKSYSRWDDYTKARDAMFAATDTPWAPWFVVGTDDKERGRLNLISHLLSPGALRAAQDDGTITLPKRKVAEGGERPDLPLKLDPDAVLTGRHPARASRVGARRVRSATSTGGGSGAAGAAAPPPPPRSCRAPGRHWRGSLSGCRRPPRPG